MSCVASVRNLSRWIVLAILISSLHAYRQSSLKPTKEERRMMRKANKLARQRSNSQNFDSDADVDAYLELYDKNALIWRCKNAVQPFWDGQPLPVVELYCETLGVLESAEWLHNGRKILDKDKRFKQSIVPHYARHHYFSKWLDFKLKIYNATTVDSGVYTFTATNVKGERMEQQIYVDISRKNRQKSDYLRSRKLKRRDYLRYYLFHNRQANTEYDPTRQRKSNMIKAGKNSYYMV